MGQEFFIKSENLESKVRDLLPSQGGLGAGFDLSASTQIVPIVDLTESAEGSNLRQDLQTALSLATANIFSVRNTTTTIISTTGFWRITGVINLIPDSSGSVQLLITITDGVTSKVVYKSRVVNNASDKAVSTNVDLVLKIEAGDSVTVTSNNTLSDFSGSCRQIADLEGNLINP